MHPMIRTLSMFSAALLVGACVAPWSSLGTCPEEGCDATATDSGTQTEPASSATTLTTTSTVTGMTSSGTEVDSSGTSSSSDDTSSSTTGEPLPPPSIDAHDLDPVSIDQNGPIQVTVTASNAEGVRMTLDDGVEVDLAATVDPEVFVGELAARTGLENGDHVAVFTPWRGEEIGEPAEGFYHLALPEPGSELFWETGDLIGSGRVAAMGMLPSGSIIELGMIADDQKIPRCYLRRRTKAGKWGPDDVVMLLPSSECEAIDLEIGDDGQIFVLARWALNNNDHRWWLGKIATWGAATDTISMGSWGEEAHALAHRQGDLAVCGSILTAEGDLDASVRVYREGEPEELGLFDYEKFGFQKHWFDESARDCIFLDQEKLVLIGETSGLQEWNDKVERDRRFHLTYEIGAISAPKFIVADAGPGKATQSIARGIDRDGDGRLYIVGRTCEDTCVPEGRLWIHDIEGKPLSETSLGLFSNDLFSPRSVRWSPAAYAVIASGGVEGKESDFIVRAYVPFQLDPIWSYVASKNQSLNVALTAAIGPYAEVCVGGFGANGYPAVACIGS